MKKLFSLFFAVIFVFNVTAFAEALQVTVTQAKAVAGFTLGVGSEVTLTLPGQNPIAGLFLGRLIQPSGKSDQYMFLDIKKTRVYLVPKAEVEWSNITGSTQPILSPYEQIGSTCGSYAMYDYFLQLRASKTSNSSSLSEILSTEEGRMKLFGLALDAYYIEHPNGVSMMGVMKKISQNYGMKCSMKIFKTNDDAISFLKEKLDLGIPVMVAFNLGVDMVNSSYEVQDYESLSILDRRLWVPREHGQRMAGGHTIVLAASFYKGARFKAVAVDSDWNDPRIWDVANYINPRTNMKDLEFYTCK